MILYFFWIFFASQTKRFEFILSACIYGLECREKLTRKLKFSEVRNLEIIKNIFGAAASREGQPEKKNCRK